MKRTLAILCLTGLLTGMNSGCNMKRGCTDVNSDNYDTDAKEDDDTCIPTRDKFIGEYDSHGTIEIDPDVLTSYDQVAVNIQDSTSDAPMEMIIGISNFDAAFYGLSATVSGTYEFMVDNQWLGDFNYFGSGSISGRVLEMNMTRIEKIEVLPDEFDYDTLYLNLYGIQELED